MRKFLIAVVFFISYCLGPTAQDVIPVQYEYASNWINPAYSATIPGNFSIGALYRNQWNPLLPLPYTTFTIQSDFKFEKPNAVQGAEPHAIGLGILFLTDRQGRFEMTNTGLRVSPSYLRSFNQNLKIGLGFQLGIGQRNINFENIRFGDQFNDIDMFNRATAENLPRNNFGYIDLGIGAMMELQLNDQNKLTTGLSYYHFNKPNTIFETDQNKPVFSDGFNNQLKPRVSFHISLHSQISPYNRIDPQLVLQHQYDYTSVLLGQKWRHQLGGTTTQVIVGTHLRANSNPEKTNLESFILSTGINIEGFEAYISYEANLTSFPSDVYNRSILELAFKYIGNYENNRRFYPEF